MLCKFITIQKIFKGKMLRHIIAVTCLSEYLLSNHTLLDKLINLFQQSIELKFLRSQCNENHLTPNPINKYNHSTQHWDRISSYFPTVHKNDRQSDTIICLIL